MGKKKFYLTLDTETATLPFANQICANAKQKQAVAIAKPLVYDIGWCITDRQGNILKKENFLIQETFFVPNVFNTAYYCDKRPVYMKLLEEGEICAKTWEEAMQILQSDLEFVDIATAYNAAFDFKKAIPFTERYIKHLYSADYNEWERKQKYSCENIAKGKVKDGTRPDYLEPVFKFRGKEYPIADLWQLACERLINIDKYRNYCLQNKLLTASAQYFKTSAETSFQYLMNQYDFIEDHTALSDAMIEAMILTKGLRKGAVNPQMCAFPFRNLGTTTSYVEEKQSKYADIVAKALLEYLTNYEGSERYKARVSHMVDRMNKIASNNKRKKKGVK